LLRGTKDFRDRGHAPARFTKAILIKRGHTLGDRLRLNFRGRRTRLDHLPDALADDEHLVRAKPTPIACAFAGVAALRFQDPWESVLRALKGRKRRMQMARRPYLLFAAVAAL